MNIETNNLGDLTSCLKILISLGHEAQLKLNALNQYDTLPWECVYSELQNRLPSEIPDCSRPDYIRWINNLASWSKGQKIAAPNLLTRNDARRALQDIWGERISVRRVASFYKRVWKVLELDSSIWNLRPSTRKSEYYRRLTLKEVNRLAAFLHRTNRDLADMVTIGYYTGLRLSDVVELERDEIDKAQHCLRLVPNKLRTRTSRILRIPLVRQALQIVQRRCSQHSTTRFLFDERVRKMTSRKIVKAFRLCGIYKNARGRASFHSLRATFISLMDDAQIQPFLTDAITGHASGNMHARYSQPSLDALRKAILTAIPPLDVSDGLSET